jgi:hypothetical protein
VSEPGTDDYATDAVRRSAPPAVGIALAAVAAACLLAAAFSHRWLANPYRGDFGFSLLSFQACAAGDCRTQSNFEIVSQAKEMHDDSASNAFPVAGVAAFAALLAAAAGLIGAVGLAAARQRRALPISPTSVALLGIMAGLVAGCVFVATKPGETGAVGVAWSFWAFGIGSILGIAGAQLLAKQIRPIDPDLLHDAMNPDQF